MGASSVTGVGNGTAMPNPNGPGNSRNQFVPLSSPHIIAAGRVSLDAAGDATVTIPVADDLGECIVVGNSLAAAHAVGITNSVFNNVMTITLIGTAFEVVSYAVITSGLTLA